MKCSRRNHFIQLFFSSCCHFLAKMPTYEEMGPANEAPPPPPPNQKGEYPLAAVAPLREGDELNLDSTDTALKEAKEKAIEMVNKGKAELEKKPNRRDEIILVVVVGVFCVVLTIVALIALVFVGLIAAKVI
ncbi:unnamed protein product, partial [Mesorhabditis belari]|uniref:Uncharacterized protein n=1 Tax=Mesorhabditis belari TaxID=2138241 RepID=A0AAF3J9L8_9BILA